MKYIKILAIFMSMMVFTSCSSLTINVEELIEPPVLSKEQAEITEALKKSLNTDELKLKYPRYGENRSSIIFEDLDGDEDDEVIVFYEEELDSSATIRINIMDKIREKWHSVYDVPGVGKEVSFVSFANISNKNKKDIIIGWKDFDKGKKKNLNIYTYGDNTLKSLLSMRYDEIIIVPSDEKENMSVAVVFSYGSSDPTAKLIKGIKRDKVGVVDLSKLNSDTEKIEKVSYGKSAVGENQIYVDSLLEDGTYVTEVMTYSGKSLTNLMADQEYNPKDILFDTERSERVISEDINGDGIIDIPSQKIMPGYEKYTYNDEDEEQQEIAYLTSYYDMKNNSLYPVESAFINRIEGYKVIFPEKWLNNRVTVKKQPNSGEYYFSVFNENLEKSQSVLLKIHVYAKDDYKDLFELQQFKLIGTRGNFEYYGYIPDKSESELKITYEELENMFKFI